MVTVTLGPVELDPNPLATMFAVVLPVAVPELTYKFRASGTVILAEA